MPPHRSAPRTGTQLFDDATSLVGLFEQVALATPLATCLLDDARAFTYEEVRRFADGVAARLRHAGVRPGDRVGLLLGRGATIVPAVLGTLRCGAAYVPLDPDYPDERLRYVVDDAGIRYLLGDPERAGRLGRLDLVVVDAWESDNPDGESDNPDGTADHPVPGTDDPAYVIYTSGSTGRPKGCVVTHGNVLALLRAALPLFRVGGDDRWSLFHSPSFDFSVWELWGALATGATAVVVPPHVARRPDEFLALLAQQRVTVLNQVPSAFRSLVTAQGDDPAALHLRYVVFGGESVDLDVVTAFLRNCRTPPRVVNMYGITETTVHVTFKEIGAGDLHGGARSPIGQPLPHLTVELRDDDGAEVPDGEPGEMWVAGAGVAAGYLNRPELTAERFVTLDGVRHYRSGDLARRDAAGELEYLGRNDQQVKLRGFRVELGEIEEALRAHDDVTDAAATVVHSPAGAQFLVAVVVTAAPLDRRTLREHVAGRLPAHMVPDRIRTVAALPLTASGKLDRAALVDVAAPQRPACAGAPLTDGTAGGSSRR